MEFSERKRRRKSQSFKLVQEQDLNSGSFDSDVNIHVNGESKDATMPEAWLGDEGMEIKRQITGMMRLLSDKAGRVYQRVGAEGDSLKQEPQEEHQSWEQLATLPPVLEECQMSVWRPAEESEAPPLPVSTPVPKCEGSGKYGTRSKTQRMLNTKGAVKTNDVDQAVVDAPCCMCNCKSTLQAILQELRAMRRLMQTQKGVQEKQEHTSPPCPPCPVPPALRRRSRKRRPVHKVAPLTAPKRAAVLPLPPCVPLERLSRDTERPVLTPTLTALAASPDLSAQTLSMQNKPIQRLDVHSSSYRQPKGLQTPESEVRLAEDYDVFIPKAQLDSILVNYTRSGSLLFRKLVCAFFDDNTLANSLPNGKRKRGLNDHRKGLDQNIVGAIKVFTEKYCTAHRIEKLPGPRDWVQILQDQIKLARRRLKRESLQLSGEMEREFLTTGPDSNKPGRLVEVGKNVTD
ncbi:BEN domain-containing protein 7 isoform X2 [Esox lucius]|uniref:BEN domain-containing protein n=1 Tax=Esox lucius TaxID=8010 RepID=A0A3P8Z578_ESOLU|nr:BEN domain-containing protein 7 isoform X2 [Esox lucius]